MPRSRRRRPWLTIPKVSGAPTDLTSQLVASPVGTLKLVATSQALVAVLWGADDRDRISADPGSAAVYAGDHPVLLRTKTQLEEYFTGTRRHFDLPLEMQGTPFQQLVWSSLRSIPYGETRSYGQIAAALGMPNASRAVGAANGRNPLSIIVPCHRVVGATGRLTGFAGGMAAKAYLLALESTRPSLFS